jgi:hypothetical protein
MGRLPENSAKKGMANCLLPYLGAAIACMFLLLYATEVSAGQKELLEKKVKELIELNRIVVEKNVDLGKYNNQTVYIRARLQQISDSEYNVKVEDLSVEGLKEDAKKDGDSVVIKVKISEKPDKTFYLDMEHILPPEKKESDNKGKGETK